jgi:thiol-disulfide isomerase/thioredoxin
MQPTEKQNVIQKTTKQKLTSWGVQLFIYLGIFFAISWYQQKDMLAVGNLVAQAKLNLIAVNGQIHRSQLDNGKNDTFIYFFAPWCSICHASIDNLEAIYQSKPDELDIIVVALDWRSIEEVDQFLSQHKLTMPVLLGTNEVRDNFQISAFPSYYLISRLGEVQSKNIGYSTELGMKWRLNFGR